MSPNKAQHDEGSDPNQPKYLAILTVRNEGAFLLEWLAHHRAVGFNRFLVFSNDCDDGTDSMLDHLQSLGWLTHLRNDGPYHKRGIQFTALKKAQGHPLVKETDWILPLDIDEFVTIKTGNHTIPDLLAALPHATAITLTWRLFGSAGQKTFEDVPVPQRFTHAAPDTIYWPWRAVMFKTLYRNDGTYGAPGVHRPRNPRTNRLHQARWFDTCGRELTSDFHQSRIFSNYGIPHYALAQLNHYPLGDMQSFVLKADRGRAVHGDDRLGLDYWTERNFNTQPDTAIEATRPAAEQLKADLLRDDRLKELHRDAVKWRHSRFETLMQDETFRSLYGRLLMTGPSQFVPVQDAQFLINCATKANESPQRS